MTRKFHTLLSIVNGLFLLLFFIVAWNARLATDDFYFLGNLNQYGIPEGTRIEYSTWSTRWASVFLNMCFLAIEQKLNFRPFIFCITSLVGLIGSVYLLIKNLLALSAKAYSHTDSLHRFTVVQTLNISIFFTSVIFLSTIKINETWFWQCASATYLWSNMMMIFGAAWILHPHHNRLLAIPGIIAFIYIGGSSGPLALLVMEVLILLFLMYFRNSEPFKKVHNGIHVRMFVAFVACLSAFLVLYSGHGNRVREAFFEKPDFVTAFLLNFKMTGIIVLKKLPLIIPFAVVFCQPFIGFGYLTNRTSGIKKIIWVTIAYFLLVFLFQLPVTYKTQDISADRLLFGITVITILFFYVIGFITGQLLSTGKINYRLFFIAPLLIGGGLFFFHAISQWSITSKYAAAYDDRMEFLQQHKECTGTLELEPLPFSGMIYSAEVSPDPSFHVNQHLVYGLGLNCEVVLKDETLKGSKNR